MEAEATVAILQKRLYQKKEVNVRSMADLAQVRTDRLHRMKNVQMQIVLKQGYVEVPMHGNISDFQDAILISRKEVEDINALILVRIEQKKTLTLTKTYVICGRVSFIQTSLVFRRMVE